MGVNEGEVGRQRIRFSEKALPVTVPAVAETSYRTFALDEGLRDHVSGLTSVLFSGIKLVPNLAMECVFLRVHFFNGDGALWQSCFLNLTTECCGKWF